WGLVDVAAADEELGGSEEPKEVDRLKGKDRYRTALEISQNGWEDGALEGGSVILARGDDFADALAGVPLADALDSPILLMPSDEFAGSQDEVNAEVDRLGADKTFLLGGDDALSKETEESLNNETKRLAGETRVETAVEIAEWLVNNGFA